MRRCPFVLASRCVLTVEEARVVACYLPGGGGERDVASSRFCHSSATLRCPAKRLHAVQCMRVRSVSFRRPSLNGRKGMDINIYCVFH